LEEELIRILVIDDSVYNRRVLGDIIDQSGFARTVGIARDGEEGLKKAFELRPDLITLDLEMPRMDGFTFLRIMMKSLPTPVVVVSSLDEDKNVFKALELGALDFVAKPDTKLTVIDQFQNELLQKLKIARQIRMRNVQRRISQEAATQLAPGVTPAVKPSEEIVRRAELIAIGASTGGPGAIQNIITRLPRDLSAGVVISQHMPPGFTRAFADRLGRIGLLAAKEAEPGDLVEKGRVLVAPGGKNLLIERVEGKVIARIEDKTDDDRYIPSVDKLLKSSAKVYGPRMIAVVLTGMGSDGRDGVIAVKDAGGYVIAESEKTSIVFGMPREAIATRKVDQVSNLEEIPREILKFC
jgi:two-component system, chemotaxis family, protein-glutamate methylesterase/glutaminase